jgi:hypothetical protein
MEPYRGRGMPDLPWKGGCGFQAPPGPPLSSCSPSSSWTSWARTAVLLIWSLLVGMIWGLLAGVGAVLSAVAAIVRAPIARRRSEPAQPSRLVRLGAASVGLELKDATIRVCLAPHSLPEIRGGHERGLVSRLAAVAA